MDLFLTKLADILEVDEVRGSSALRDFAQWDSLSALSVIAMVDGEYGVQLTANDLKGSRTAEDLYQAIQKKSRP